MPRGGARPGAGRPPAKVLHFEPPAGRPTFADVFSAPSAPAAAGDPAGGFAPSPPVPNLQPPAPIVPIGPPAPSAANQSFAEMAAYVGVGIAVVQFGKSLKAEGLDAGEPDTRAYDAAINCTSEGIVLALGDTIVPWWAGMAVAFGNLYLSMRMGATKVDERPTHAEQVRQQAQQSAEAPHVFGRAPEPPPQAPPPVQEQAQQGLFGLEDVRRTGT